ncbi:hybrid sensor histidine kinase/response regulator [Pseudobutyrivibrio sp.]|uniref:hybrid sensor histidine kinase/response regulator n=1 Tax=Pseudobutyrivibrio sp. TaxID=2014367 RepID=UPI0025E983AD|nr:ATP-binding protein [Pseudobutyrivibrio sp.]MBR5650030.1 response regulator [Pseudobutyrivibrio sp.]
MINKGLLKTVGALMLAVGFTMGSFIAYANDVQEPEPIRDGGGYAVSNQVYGVGYATELYDANNGLPTSDASCILADSKGYIWIGSYSGIIRYDGTSFVRMDSAGGLTSGKTLFEDSHGRIWVGTNDNGVAVIDGADVIRYTYMDGLLSSSIRAFAEDRQGTIYIATTGGICYLEDDGTIKAMEEEALKNCYINRIFSERNGRIVGSTKNGELFTITDKKLNSFESGESLGFGKVTAVYAGSDVGDLIYIGNDQGKVYEGFLDETGKELDVRNEVDVSPAVNVSWISCECETMWIVADETVGYVDLEGRFNTVKNIPLDSSIEMVEADYQGNLWMVSTRQGVAKIVSNNFQDITDQVGLEKEVVNSTCRDQDLLYIGTDKGLQIIDLKKMLPVENELTEFIGDTRIRCIANDFGYGLWICCYNNGKGLVHYSRDGEITSYTEENGFLSDGVRCATLNDEGQVLIGTNKGIVVMRQEEVEYTITEENGLDNVVCLTVEQGLNGEILVGTDGGGMYIVKDGQAEKITREDGLTSDVILRIKRDEDRNLYWIITSNSIQYLKNGVVYEVKNFPYSNNFDIYFDDNGNAWILSSNGIYCVAADDLIQKDKYDYRFYDMATGLTSVPTGNSFSAIDFGTLYIAGRNGVNKVDIDNFYSQSGNIKVGVKSIVVDDEEIAPDENGKYVIPSTTGRITINAAIINYNLSNPLVHMYLEGNNDSGITENQSKLSSLEYTGLKYGDYKLHIQILDESNGTVYQDRVVEIEKQPKLSELMVFRILMMALVAVLVGLLVWRIMSGTVIRRQYKEIQAAKREVEKANSVKSRFLANMSHEIRTPINTIMGMDEMIMRENATDVPKPYFKAMMNYAGDIKAASESLLNLIDDVLDMSRIESGKMHLVEQEYNLEEEIRGMVKMIRARSDQKGLLFTVDVDEKLPKVLYGDIGKLKQVIINLLSNAVKYTKKGRIEFFATVEEINGNNCKIRFAVKDTGIGIKKEDISKVFEAFERVDEQKNSGIQGTGLGLDISRQFSKLMNGELKCDSVYGEGSEFTFIVPQKIVDASPIGKFVERKDEAKAGLYKPQFIAPDAAVLVVDDNPMNLNVIKGLLSSTKMFISTANTGEECLDKLKSSNFNVVLLDHFMQGMDGVATMAKIKERYPDLPVFAITANTEAGGEEFYLSKGFSGYFQKPIDGVMLEKTIRKYLPDDIVEDVIE